VLHIVWPLQLRGARFLDVYLWVALGSALGGLARYACSGWVAQRFGETFPWGTITVNVVGSFLIGLVATLTGPDGRLLVPGHARDFVMIGVFGGFTTFSSFSLQTLALAREGEWLGAGLNIVVSVVACLVAVWAGHSAALAINH
jgi:fluoride exporter